MIRVLFVCHGNIFEYPERACKINDFKGLTASYYTTITPFWKRA